MDTFACWLPGGYFDATGALHREAELIPLGGREEELLAGTTGQSNAALATRILSRCVYRIGAVSPVSEVVARDLLVADRQYLMLKLREATFGDRVAATITCPWPDCGKRVDIDFSLHDIPVSASDDRGPTYGLRLSAAAAYTDETGEKHRDVVFRLPTGADQEIVAPLAPGDDEHALTVLLSRCIRSLGDLASPDVAIIRGLDPLAREEIDRAMEAVAPRLDLNLSGLCPECGREFTQPFDIQDFFFAELRISRALLYREVHYLAYHYHWSEREIMELPRTKRRMYIEILADEIERLNHVLA